MIAIVILSNILILAFSYNSANANNDFTVIDTFNFPFNFSTDDVECINNIKLYSDSLKNNTLWAYRMWESSAKLPLGLTEGSQYQLGNFDECLSIKEPFASQYCLATIYIDVIVNITNIDPFSLEYRPYMNLYEKLDYTNDPNKIRLNQDKDKVYWSLCLPASCAVEEVQNELQKYLNEKHNPNLEQFKVEISYEDCQTEQINYKYTYKDFLFCFVISCFVFIVGISTIYDFIYIDEINCDTNKSVKLLLCFSARQNYHELNKPDGSNKKLSIFYGTKFVFMAGIIYVHGHVIRHMGPILNIKVVEEIYRTSIYVNRIDVFIEIFLLIGGLLNTYSYLSQVEKKTFNALRSIILRYFRFVPVFAIMTFFYATLFYKTGSGPLWPKIIGKEKQNCEISWWTNMLLINNYINVETDCILQGWYIGLDFQLFILALPLNYLIKKNSKLCWTVFTAVLLATTTIPILIIYFGEKDAVTYIFNHTNFFYTVRETDYYRSVYVPAHTRMASYIIGMFFGFIFYKYKDSKLKISFIPSFIILIIFGIIPGVACFFSGWFLYNPYLPANKLYGALYASLHRVAFAIAGGVTAFILSYGSILTKRILTWHPMIPLSKLAFSAYLVHFTFQLVIPASARNPINLSHFDSVCRAISELVLSFIASFVLFICIENPCSRFMKELIPSNFCKRHVK